MRSERGELARAIAEALSRADGVEWSDLAEFIAAEISRNDPNDTCWCGGITSGPHSRTAVEIYRDGGHP